MKHLLVIIAAAVLLLSCGPGKQTAENQTLVKPDSLSFSSTLIADAANLWWARAFAEVDGDGILDIALIENNGSGGWLGYLKGRTDGQPWEKVIVAERAPNGNTFAAGDLEVADMDGDGDTDLIAVAHTGEWDKSTDPATLYWYEQTEAAWIPHLIGTIPSFLKDISVGDLDKDGSPEVITATFDAATLSIFTQTDTFIKAQEYKINNLHEGMDIGDIDGDGWIDIAANGYWLKNPGSLEQEWPIAEYDSIWHNQNEKHWARNATKTACKDVDGDGKVEIFTSHSEKAGYPVAKYDFENGQWEKEVILSELPAAHNLQIADINNDGVYEVLTGVNRNRAIGIAKERGESVPTEFLVMILSPSEDRWTNEVINTDGSYNLLVGDLEGDGDMDLIRWTSHDRPDMWLMKNEWVR